MPPDVHVPAGRADSNRALAAALEVHPRTIGRALRAGLPVEPDGTFDIERCRAWMRTRARSAARRGPAAPLGAFVSTQAKSYGGGPLSAEEKFSPPDAPADATSRDLAVALAEATLEWRRVRSELEGVRLAKLRGDLVDRRQMATMVASWAAAFSRGLMAVDSRLSHLTDADAVRRQMRQEHRRLLEEFATAGKTLEKPDAAVRLVDESSA